MADHRVDDTVVAVGEALYDGLRAAELEARLGVPSVVLFDELLSTMDVAHALAADGAPARTLVISDRQTAGRGRAGHGWVSPAGSGIWLTLIGRPRDVETVSVLALRVGVHLAAALDAFAERAIGLKWPNDLMIEGRKVAGVLVEARWQDQRPVWVAIGVGINVEPPEEVARATGLRPGTSRVSALGATVAALLTAESVEGPLLPSELGQFAARDIAFGRRCVAPATGRVAGIAPTGELLIAVDDGAAPKGQPLGQRELGQIRTYRSGSLILEGEGLGEGAP